jgi:hypothetical protein
MSGQGYQAFGTPGASNFGGDPMAQMKSGAYRPPSFPSGNTAPPAPTNGAQTPFGPIIPPYVSGPTQWRQNNLPWIPLDSNPWQYPQAPRMSSPFSGSDPGNQPTYTGGNKLGTPPLQRQADTGVPGQNTNGGRQGSGLPMTDAFLPPSFYGASLPSQGGQFQRMQDSGVAGPNVNGGRQGSGLPMTDMRAPTFQQPPPPADAGASLLAGINATPWRKPGAPAAPVAKMDDPSLLKKPNPDAPAPPELYRPAGPPPNLPMQRGQIDFGWAGSPGNQPSGIGSGTPAAWGDYTPRLSPEALAWTNRMIYQGGGNIAPWANQIDMNDYVGSIERLSGQRFGG